MNAEMNEQVSELKSDLSKLRADLSELMQSFVEAGKTQTAEARAQIEARITQKMEELRKAMDSTRERGREAMHRLGTTVEHNPGTSLLTAVGVGFLIGYLVSRR